jgi:hypothetical protein
VGLFGVTVTVGWGRTAPTVIEKLCVLLQELEFVYVAIYTLEPVRSGMLSISREVEVNLWRPVQLQVPEIGWGPRSTTAEVEATVAVDSGTQALLV